jgi:hypothetical protein
MMSKSCKSTSSRAAAVGPPDKKQRTLDSLFGSAAAIGLKSQNNSCKETNSSTSISNDNDVYGDHSIAVDLVMSEQTTVTDLTNTVQSQRGCDSNSESRVNDNVEQNVDEISGTESDKQAPPPRMASMITKVDFDIGDVDFSDAQSLSDSEKYEILTNIFKPKKTWKGPLHKIGKKCRRIPCSVFDESRSTFSYSVKRDGVLCAPCSVFAKTNELFVREYHCDWSNIERHMERHMKCMSHMNAVEASSQFLKVCQGKQGSVKQQLSKVYNDKVQRNKAALISIVKTIVLCGRQNLPLRGHTDERSNFSALLEYRAECDELLHQHLSSSPKNAMYVSHRIQNELISICGQQLLSSVLLECRRARFYSLLIDETTDASVREQVSVVLLFIDESFRRREEFTCFEETADTTGETLYNLICNKLTASDTFTTFLPE